MSFLSKSAINSAVLNAFSLKAALRNYADGFQVSPDVQGLDLLAAGEAQDLVIYGEEVHLLTPNVLYRDIRGDEMAAVQSDFDRWAMPFQEYIWSNFPIKQFARFEERSIGFLQDINPKAYRVKINKDREKMIDPDNLAVGVRNGPENAVYWNFLTLASFLPLVSDNEATHRVVFIFEHLTQGFVDFV